MGEQKRRESRMDDFDKTAMELQRELANKGLLIEAGWAALRNVWVPKDASPAQVRDMRWAFMAGAQHLFVSIMGTLDEEAEPTDADMARMEKIAAELEAFEKEIHAALPTKGSA